MNGNPTIWRCAVADHYLQIRGDCYSTDSELFLWPLPTYGDQLVEFGTLEDTHARTHERTHKDTSILSHLSHVQNTNSYPLKCLLDLRP